MISRRALARSVAAAIILAFASGASLAAELRDFASPASMAASQVYQRAASFFNWANRLMLSLGEPETR